MNPDLEDLLTQSAPPLSESPDIRPAVAELVHATRGHRMRRRTGRRGVLLGTTTAGIALAGSAAAAALTIGGWTAPWADDPDGALTFTLPSGTECEWRIGNLYSSSPAETDELRSWLDDHTLAQIADIPAAIKEMRAEDPVWVKDDGTEVPIGYGTKYYDADEEYASATLRAIGRAVNDRAEELGVLREGGSLSSEGEIRCANGVNPMIAKWQR